MLFDRVKLLSEKRGKTLQEVALELGISVNALYKWRHQNPKVDTIQKAADYFQVSVDYLLGRTEEPNGYYYSEKTLDAVDMIIDSNNKDFIELIENLPTLDENELKVVNDMVKSLVALKQKKS
ncbi:helix-turn-helix domain-containing protein [Enterococcus rotai]|uniref:helix-turn-helix domain-containing protein n=1 Tax=Enterococcus rotai TaxID=118060 RepID=UPI0035C74B27